MKSSRRLTATRFYRLAAAVWFAGLGGLVALLAAAFFTYYPEPTPFILARSVLVVTFITGATGAVFGSWILDPEAVESGLIAALIGVFVAGFSCEVSVCALLSISYLSMEYPQLGGFIYSVIMMSVAVALMAGWLVALLGGLAGWLLFRQRREITARFIPA